MNPSESDTLYQHPTLYQTIPSSFFHPPTIASQRRGISFKKGKAKDSLGCLMSLSSLEGDADPKFMEPLQIHEPTWPFPRRWTNFLHNILGWSAGPSLGPTSPGNPSIEWPDGFIKAAAKHKFAPEAFFSLTPWCWAGWWISPSANGWFVTWISGWPYPRKSYLERFFTQCSAYHGINCHI